MAVLRLSRSKIELSLLQHRRLWDKRYLRVQKCSVQVQGVISVEAHT